MSQKEKKLKISMKNTSPEVLKNVTIRIYESHGFFGKDKKVEIKEKWEPQEIVNIVFKPKQGQSIRYLLKIEDEEEMLKIKRIQD